MLWGNVNLVLVAMGQEVPLNKVVWFANTQTDSRLQVATLTASVAAKLPPGSVYAEDKGNGIVWVQGQIGDSKPVCLPLMLHAVLHSRLRVCPAHPRTAPVSALLFGLCGQVS